MKLCFIADANSIHTKRWIEPLLRQGHEVQLISYKAIQQTDMRCSQIDLTQITNIRKLRFFVWGLWLRNFLHKTTPDLLHAHQLQAAGWLATMSGFQPFVVSSWGSDLLIEPQKSPLRKLLIAFVLRQATAITVPSPILSSQAKKIGVPDNKIYTIPWGLETNIFYPSQDEQSKTRHKLANIPGEQVIFCPRSIQRIYNIDILIAAFVNVRNIFPGARLMLVDYNSDSKYKRELLNFIVNKNIEARVIWINAQDKEEMAHIYRAADITVSIPSSEGFGISVYEAIACGCPTIISDLPTFSGLAHEKEVVKVPVRNIELTTTAIVQLLRDPQKRHQIRENGILATQGMTSANQVEKALNLYRDLISHK